MVVLGLFLNVLCEKRPNLKMVIGMEIGIVNAKAFCIYDSPFWVLFPQAFCVYDSDFHSNHHFGFCFLGNGSTAQ